MPILILIVIILLCLMSIYLLRKWQRFWLFIGVNLLILLAYTIYLIYGKLSFLGSDEHSLGRLSLFITVPIVHVVITFVFALVKHFQMKKLLA